MDYVAHHFHVEARGSDSPRAGAIRIDPELVSYKFPVRRVFAEGYRGSFEDDVLENDILAVALRKFQRRVMRSNRLDGAVLHAKSANRISHQSGYNVRSAWWVLVSEMAIGNYQVEGFH